MTRRHRQQSHGRSGEVRPTTSRVLSALFSMFGPEGVEGLVVLDLYAGKGSFGLEALQRGAARLVMVEKNRRRCDDLKQALGNLSKDDQEPDATVVCADVLKSFGNLQGPFDVVFADPPYADNPFELVADGLQANGLVAKDGIVMLEHFHKTVLPDVLAGLSLVTRRQYGDAAVSVYRPDGVRDEEDEVGTGEGA